MLHFTLIVAFAVYILVPIQAEQCKTPNNETAECISLYSCPLLLTALGSKQNASIEFVSKSSCGGTAAEPMVCCGSSSTFIVSEKSNAASDRSGDVTKESLLPSRRYCGYQHSDDFFHTSNVTAITEFPWLGWLRHKTKDTGEDAGFVFSGSLINQRYVLTVAHSVVNSRLIPVSVRLGEYHTKNETDCTEDSHVYECSSAPEDFIIEKLIPHPDFDRKKKINNIALLRLNRNVQYSDYIRPICLPLLGTRFANAGEILSSSGWGLKQFGGAPVDTKKRSLGTLISNEECARLFSGRKNIHITEKEFCTINLNNGTDLECQGDSGGPVMFSYRGQWHQEGVISYGVGCGTQYPGVQTRVASYLNWIMENIEP